MKIWITKSCKESVRNSGMEKVYIWFRKPTYHSETKCIFGDDITFGNWATIGPQPHYLNASYLKDTDLYFKIWDMIRSSRDVDWKDWIHEMEINIVC